MPDEILALTDARLTLAGNAGPVEILKGIDIEVEGGYYGQETGDITIKESIADKIEAGEDHLLKLGFCGKPCRVPAFDPCLKPRCIPPVDERGNFSCLRRQATWPQRPPGHRRSVAYFLA